MPGPPPFSEEELRKFGRFLELLGRRLADDAGFRRMVAGDPLAQEEWLEPPSDVPIEFRDEPDVLTATLHLPPGIGRDDFRLRVETAALHLLLLRPVTKGFSFDLPQAVLEEDVRATYRNGILDVVMRKPGATNG